jgi:DNA adenine methylase
LKPPIGYYGAKATIAPAIVDLLPPHAHYVEPYAGSLAVLLAKPPAKFETVNDLDGNLVTFWRVLRDRPDELIRAAACTPHARAEYEACKPLDDEDLDDLERARRVWVILTQGRTRTLRPRGWRHYIAPAYVSIPTQLDQYVDRLIEAAERIRDVSIENQPALDLIERYGQSREVLFYVDPPYLRETRASLEYALEAADEADHRDLATVLHGIDATAVLSAYPSPLYDELFADWHRHAIETSTTQGGRTKPRTEVLYCNRPFADLGLFAV